MADLLPSIPETSAPEEIEPRVVGLDDDEADEVFAALSSETARALFAAINEDPTHPSALADSVDTSLQNAQYHLEKLEGADLVEVIDTAYSAKGREMDVYAPTDRPLVMFAGDESDQSLLSQALSRLLGGLGILSVASVVTQGLFGNQREAGAVEFWSATGEGDASTKGGASEFDTSDDGGAAAGAGGDDFQIARDGGGTYDATAESEPAVETVGTVADDFAWVGDALAATGLPPGAALFLLGSVLLAVGVGVWYRQNRAQ